MKKFISSIKYFQKKQRLSQAISKGWVSQSNDKLKKEISNLNSTAGYIEITSQSYKDISASLKDQSILVSNILDDIILDSEKTESLIAMEYKDFLNLSLEVNQHKVTLNDLFEQLAELAEIINNQSLSLSNGQDKLSLLNASIRSIENTITKISGITSSISSISKKTSLLSINASIEASHAGEHGQGFSIVSSEISKLSHYFSLSAKEIDGINSQALQNLTSIMSNFENLTGILKEILLNDNSLHKRLELYYSLVTILNESLESIYKMTLKALENLTILMSELQDRKKRFITFKSLVQGLSNGVENIYISASDLSDLSAELVSISKGFDELIEILNNNEDKDS